MLACVDKGSDYSAQILLEIYKAYYRNEYNRLKKYHKLTDNDFSDGFTGTGDPDDANNINARLIIMARIMRIDIDESWNDYQKFINEHEKGKRGFWRKMEAAAQIDDIFEGRLKERSTISRCIVSSFPEMVDEDKYGSDTRYEIISVIKYIIQLAVQRQDTVAGGLLADMDDLYINVLEALEAWYVRNNGAAEDFGFTVRELVLMAYINHMATEYGKLYRVRRKELWGLLGVSRRELVKDEDIIDDFVTKEMLHKVAEQKRLDYKLTPKDTKLIKKISSISQKKGVVKASDSV